MIKVTLDVINSCASNLKFKLSEGQDKIILDEFNTVLAQIDFLKSIKGVDLQKEMTFPYKDHQKKMRDDKPVKPYKSADILKNSNTKIGNQIKLPKVVGNNNE